LDELAKGLAGGTVSRRKALRLLGAALVGGALASIPGAAWSKQQLVKGKKPKGECVEGTTLCGGVCCVTEFCCGGENGVCCGAPNTTCVNGECVCQPGLAACEGSCCPEGRVCGDRAGGGKACCSPEELCGSVCCFSDCCNGVCCPVDEVCVNGQCSCGTTGTSCPAGEVCASGTCCPGELVCFTATEERFCCPEGTECVGQCSGGTCDTVCCAPKQVCGTVCCPAGTRCRQGACV